MESTKVAVSLSESCKKKNCPEHALGISYLLDNAVTCEITVT